MLQLVAEGKTLLEIAEILGVGRRTVETHRRRLLDKLGLDNTTELVRFAIREGGRTVGAGVVTKILA